MNSILISGCGISYGQSERPTWIKILKICGLKNRRFDKYLKI